MKIAVVTEDGITISQHFGRAPYYLVLTIENGQIVSREMREKVGHSHSLNHPHQHENPHGSHGCGPESQSRHALMASAISDCQILLAGGMGSGAYHSLKEAGIEVIITDIEGIEEAVTAYLEGKIVNHTDWLH